MVVLPAVAVLLAATGLPGPAESDEDRAWAAARQQTAWAVQTQHLQDAAKRPPALVGVETEEARQQVYRRMAERLDAASPRNAFETEAWNVLHYGGDEAAAVVTAMLNGPEEGPARAAVNLLDDIPSAAALDALIHAAEHHTRAAVRADAILHLACATYPGALPALRAAVSDPDPLTAQRAVEGLGRLCDRDSFDRLAALARDDEWVRLRLHAVATALWQIDPERAPGVMTAAAADNPDPWQREHLQRYAVRPADTPWPAPWSEPERRVANLAGSAATIARETLSPAQLDTLREFARRADSPVQDRCIRALGLLRDRPAVRGLIAETRRRPYRGTFAALVRIGTPEALDHVARTARHGNLHERKAVAGGLGQAGRAGAPLLVRMLDDAELRTRHEPFPGEHGVPVEFPEGHAAFGALRDALSPVPGAVESSWHNLAAGPLTVEEDGVKRPFDVDREIAKFRRWWVENGNGVVHGLPVGPFKFYTVMYVS